MQNHNTFHINTMDIPSHRENPSNSFVHFATTENCFWKRKQAGIQIKRDSPPL